MTKNCSSFVDAFPLMQNDPNETKGIYLKTIAISFPF